MLFDIRGRRKRFIQVIYVFLALLLGGGLVIFGIGGDAAGGLGDAVGLGNSSSGSGDSGFESEVEEAEATLATDPDNTEALLALARYSYLNGQTAIEQDEQGAQTLTDEAVSDFEASIDAWERYLKANKGQPSADVAVLVFRAYSSIALNSSNPTVIQRRLDGTQKAAEVIVEERPGPNTYLDLAAASYVAGDTKAGDKAAEQALKGVDEASRGSLESQLKAAKRQGKAIQRQLKAQKADPDALEDPLGGLGTGVGAPDAGVPSG